MLLSPSQVQPLFSRPLSSPSRNRPRSHYADGAAATRSPIPLPIRLRSCRNSSSSFPQSLSSSGCRKAAAVAAAAAANAPGEKHQQSQKSFWGGVSLIVGTAVGPGMLALPSATIRSGPVPSTAAILLSWLYVVSSILLVAELSFLSMEENDVDEVSFTGLAAGAFGPAFGALIALVYTSLSFALLVACVSGIGSLLSELLPSLGWAAAHAAFPCLVGAVIAFLPFKAIDAANRVLCSLMLLSITALVIVGVSVGRAHMLSSFAFASWTPSAILPAIPVTVLTLGFHVITPFMCRIVGDTMFDARKAILLGGSIPLAMVLSWNLVILGLAGSSSASRGDPIKLLLSVNPSALPAVRGFAFTALATSLIGYAVSFPKQLVDTAALIVRMVQARKMKGEEPDGLSSSRGLSVMWIVLGSSILIGSYMQASFSKALDFAGVYANCFLFGILPPAMAWIHRSRRRNRSSDEGETSLLPGGNISLLLLFATAIGLWIWH